MTTTMRERLTAMTGALALLLTVIACSSTDSAPAREGPASAPTASSPAGSISPEPDQTTEESTMQITITFAGERLTATLTDSPAARDLLAQLPVTVDMVDHGGVEKTGPLPQPLSLDGQPDGADPEPGDLGYYAPGNDLVLYYGDQSYFPGIVVLGRLDDDAAERIPAIDGPVRATVEAG